MSRELTTQALNAGLRGALMPQTFDQVMRFANTMSSSQFVPQAFRGRSGDIVAAITYGADLGLSPMQALQNIAIVNGRPAIYGDGLLAVCQSHPNWGGKKEWLEGEGDKLTAHCTVSRKGEPDAHVTFSVADAKKANLWGKSGPWTQYPQRMLAMRARGFALRDQFADALRGIILAEEAQDTPIGPDRARDVTPRSAIPDPADTVEVVDQYGASVYLDPIEVPAWATAHAKECTDDELDELYSVNSGNAAVRDAIEAEVKARKAAFSDQPPADTADTAATEPALTEAEKRAKGREFYKQAKEALAAKDYPAAVKCKLKALPYLDNKGIAAFDALLNEAPVETSEAA